MSSYDQWCPGPACQSDTDTATDYVQALTTKRLGSLNRVRHVVRLRVYIGTTPEYTERGY
jgi:hypothetical protein